MPPVDYSNVNLTLQQFQSVSDGEFNAGDVHLAGQDKIEKINNHVVFTLSNKKDINTQETLAIKNAFVRALEQNGVTDEAKLGNIRQRLGLGEAGQDPADPLKAAKPLTRQEIREILDEHADTINKFGTTKIVTSAELYKKLDAKELSNREASRNKVNQDNETRLKSLYLSTNRDRASRLAKGDFRGLSAEERADMRRFVLNLLKTLDSPEGLENKVHFTFNLDDKAQIFVPDPTGLYNSATYDTGKTKEELRQFLEQAHESLVGYKDKMSAADATKVSNEIIKGLVKGDFSQAPRSFISAVNSELQKFAWETGFDPLTMEDIQNLADRNQFEAALKASIGKNGKLDASMFVLELRRADVPGPVSRAREFASELQELLRGHPLEGINRKKLTPEHIRKFLELSPALKERLEACKNANDVKELVNGRGRIDTWYQLKAVGMKSVLTARLDEVFTKDGLRNLVLNELTFAKPLSAKEMATIRKEFKMPASLSDEAIAKKKAEILENIEYGRYEKLDDLNREIKKFALEPLSSLQHKLDDIYSNIKEPAQPAFYMMALLADQPEQIDTRAIRRAAENEAVSNAYVNVQLKRMETSVGEYPAANYAEDLRKLGNAIADSLEEELKSSNVPVDRNSGEFRKLVGYVFMQKVGDGGMLFRIAELKSKIKDVAHGQYDWANIFVNIADDYHTRFTNMSRE